MSEQQFEGAVMTIHTYKGGVNIGVEQTTDEQKLFVLAERDSHFMSSLAVFLSARTKHDVVNIWYENKDNKYNLVNGVAW